MKAARLVLSLFLGLQFGLAFEPRVKTGLELLSATIKFHPGRFEIEDAMRLLGNEEAAVRLRRGDTGREVYDATRSGVEGFRKIRARYLLYE